MRVALVAPPFIPVPPRKYGGTELFVAQLAEGLKKQGIDVVVYANGESTVDTEVRSLYAKSQWPIEGEVFANLTDINHSAWAIRDASKACDIIHVNSAPALAMSRLVDVPMVYTMHHVHDEHLAKFYAYYPEVEFVTISDFQRQRESMARMRTIHHGLDTNLYTWKDGRREHLSFLGRIAPMKGTHLAIEVAKRAGIPLKIAGEIQPCYRGYWESQVKPHVDGKFIEYVGEADLPAKNELLKNSIAMLFPIQWHEPFGLVMIEAMACGAPVLALSGGAVEEVVSHGVGGFICKDVEDMAARAKDANKFDPARVREYVEREFSLEKMVSRYAELFRDVVESRALAAPEAEDIEPLTQLSGGNTIAA
ncbi:glycosyl transferase, group 1 [Candidatus Koribacter versatilis Ellin345]|uniref:Glycosyl transferase, group 1 n=1 Tax=Koribacter versatilis (strain Ellin345) TaxID=204669 RepID=Q1ILI9_KORVE|nr:glycosyltransferase family 4 protein [Candidatus Koribacter versatilis]ABF42261.1 glycosyl transferase, group 1 [Candidatus Koribacter versatilis Ellin345]